MGPEVTPAERELYDLIAAGADTFIEGYLGEKCDPQQVPILKAIKSSRRVAVKSGHSCFGLGTRVLMFDGSTKAVEDVIVGDRLMGDDSTPRTVRHLARGREPMYRVAYRDGTQYVHNESHVLVLVAMASHSAYRTGDMAEVEVGDFLRWPKEKRRRHGGFRIGVEYPQKHQPIPAYVLGLWLGDGCDSGADFCNTDAEVLDALDSYAQSIGCRLSPNSNGRNYWLSHRGQGTPNPFITLLKGMGLVRNKHIPQDYMAGSRAQRLELLAGLLDTDGSQGESGSYDFIQKRRPLSEQVVTLVRSLGGHATMTLKHVATHFSSGHFTEGIYWRVYISAGLDIPCRIARKKSSHHPVRMPTRYGVKSIEPLGEGDYYGFNVDGNHRFLGADFMVLRNCGKDWLAARAALWFHCTHFPSIVVTTGPTDRQVRKVVWGEIHAAHRQAARVNPEYPIGGDLLDTMLKSRDPHHYMIGYTANVPEAFQGFHAENVMVVVTEAQGIAPAMWPGIESLLTAPNSKLLLIGNATYEPDSEFYQAFTSKAHLYTTFTLDSESSPHCSPEYVREMREIHGVDSPMYLARVKGIFPTDIADTLIPLGWIDRARARWLDIEPRMGGITLGVDVARFGTDLTVFYLGDGLRYRCIHAVQGQDLMQTCGAVVVAMREHHIPAENVRIDDTGVGGGVTDRLKELGHKVTAINFGAGASREEDYANARAELFFTLKERFRLGDIALDPTDQKLLRDLSVLRYKQTSRGQMQMEAKAEAKRKLGYSPDRADALALAAIPQSVASQLASGARSNMGILAFMKQMAERQKVVLEPANVRPMSELPQAAALLERSNEQPVRPPPWQSVVQP